MSGRSRVTIRGLQRHIITIHALQAEFRSSIKSIKISTGGHPMLIRV